MRKANLLAGCVGVAGLGLMVFVYLLAFSAPTRSVLILVDQYHEGMLELALFTVAFLVSLWNLSHDMKRCVDDTNPYPTTRR